MRCYFEKILSSITLQLVPEIRKSNYSWTYMWLNYELFITIEQFKVIIISCQNF